MIKANMLFWVVSLTLQCLLLTAVVMRGIGGRMPVFTVLIGFYIGRSIALRTLFGYLGTPSYMLLVSSLAVVDLILQTAVAWELFKVVVEPRTVSGLAIPGRGEMAGSENAGSVSLVGRLAIFSGFVLAAVGLAVLLSATLHANPRAPMDRGVLFTAALFLLVFAGSFWRGASWGKGGRAGAADRILQGFAFYGAVGIASQIGRTLAAADRNTSAFNSWSYAAPLAYLVVMVFWILTLTKSASSVPHVVGEPSPVSQLRGHRLN